MMPGKNFERVARIFDQDLPVSDQGEPNQPASARANPPAAGQILKIDLLQNALNNRVQSHQKIHKGEYIYRT